ncbi:hypothetical protein Tco_0499359 [Tanacetum coccineum]
MVGEMWNPNGERWSRRMYGGCGEGETRGQGERLLLLLAREVSEDIRKVGEYRRMSHELRGDVRRLSASIAELRDLGDYGDRCESVRLLERLRLENMEKGIRLRLMMKETQLKVIEKGNFMLKLRRDVNHVYASVIFRKELEEKIESRRIMIDYLEKVRDCPTYGWLKRLKENHAEDLKQLGILNVFVERIVRLAVFWDGSFLASASLDVCFPGYSETCKLGVPVEYKKWKVVLLVVTAIVRLPFTFGSISAVVLVLPLSFLAGSLSDFWTDMV